MGCLMSFKALTIRPITFLVEQFAFAQQAVKETAYNRCGLLIGRAGYHFWLFRQ